MGGLQEAIEEGRAMECGSLLNIFYFPLYKYEVQI